MAGRPANGYHILSASLFCDACFWTKDLQMFQNLEPGPLDLVARCIQLSQNAPAEFGLERAGPKGIVTLNRCDAGTVPANPYRGYRFPEEIISQCVWLYFNFAVSLREVELTMAYPGVHLSYETIRRWCGTFGASYAAKLKRKRPQLGDKWFRDEVFLRINGVQHYLWRAVDQQGAVIASWCSRSVIVLPRFASFVSFYAPAGGISA
jgi:DDE domain